MQKLSFSSSPHEDSLYLLKYSKIPSVLMNHNIYRMDLTNLPETEGFSYARFFSKHNDDRYLVLVDLRGEKAIDMEHTTYLYCDYESARNLEFITNLSEPDL